MQGQVQMKWRFWASASATVGIQDPVFFDSVLFVLGELTANVIERGRG
jgi:hypothetical protein